MGKVWFVVAALVLCCVAACVWAADAPVPVIEVKSVEEPPVLDGALDDACWQGLPEYTDFTDSATGKLVEPQTLVKICRDQKTIYVAFHALHPDPKRIPAYGKKRNGSINGDDWVSVMFDSSHQHRDFSEFTANSLGTQSEYLEGGSAAKIEWRGDWRAASKVVEDGYIVEMAIPFSLLKYNKDQKTFGLCFERWFPDRKIYCNWPNMQGLWDRHKFADWIDANPPWAKPRPIILGYTSSSMGAGADETRAGFDLKYPFANDSMGLISVNPDFSTIQQQVETVDFSYIEKYVPDSRPFFQEWEIYMPRIAFYSRRIPEFDMGTKLVRKMDQGVLAVLNARDIGSRSDSLLQYRRDIGSRSGVSCSFADHWIPGHRNVTTFYNGWWQFMTGQRRHEIGGGIYTTSTTDRPQGTNSDIHYTTRGRDGALSGDIRYGRIEPSFNPELGFIGDVDRKGLAGNLTWRKSIRESKIRQLNAKIVGTNYKRIDGSPFSGGYSFTGQVDFMGGRGIAVVADRSHRVPYRDATQGFRLNWASDSPDRIGGIGFNWGRKAGGDYTSLGINQMFKLGSSFWFEARYERMSLSLNDLQDNTEYAGIGRLFQGTVNYDLTSEKTISGRVTQRLGKTNIYFSYRQQVRRGMDAYFIYGDPNALESTGQVSLKLVQPLF